MRERRPSELAALAPSDMHVWKARVRDHLGDETLLGSLLGDRERARAARFFACADRSRYIIAHGLVRRLLAFYVGRDPAELTFVEGDCGKPVLSGARSNGPLGFNISHSADIILVAIARCAVGIDVEQWSRAFDVVNLARSMFSEAEQRELAATAPAEKRAAFFTGWTRKEAYVKATGLGFSAGLTTFDVSLDPHAAAPLLADRRSPNARVRWVMRDVPIDADYSASVVAERAAARLRMFDVPAGASWRLS